MSGHISGVYDLTARRRYSREEKAAMVSEAVRENSVSAVARRHRVAPAQLFRWKREFAPPAPVETAPMKKKAGSRAPASFVPVALIASPSISAPAREESVEPVEIAFPNGCVLKAPADISEAALARLIRSLKA